MTEHTVCLPGNRKFIAGESADLLSSALGQNIFLEYSCRNGRCGTCRAKLLEGSTECKTPELGLTADELREGWILTCCRSPQSDVTLDANVLDLVPFKCVTRPCKIDDLQRQGRIALLTLRLPPSERVDFHPGQYVQLGRGTASARSYSIANAPRADGKIELHIKHQPGGVFSDYLFTSAKAGDLLKLTAPMGSFFLRKQRPARMIFLATGTGIAPIKAMLEAVSQNAALGADGSEYLLYWGNRHRDDFYWTPAIPGLRYIPVLSQPDPAWSGARGHVHNVAFKDISDLSGTAVYACGSDAMIRDAKTAALKQHLPQRAFFSDAFVPSDTIAPT